MDFDEVTKVLCWNYQMPLLGAIVWGWYFFGPCLDVGELLEPKQLLGMDTVPLCSWSNVSLEKLLSEEKRVTKPPKLVLLNVVVCLLFCICQHAGRKGGIR